MPGLGSCASSGRALKLRSAIYSQGERPAHWAPRYRLGCSSEPPPKLPIPRPLTLQVPRQGTARWCGGGSDGHRPRARGRAYAGVSEHVWRGALPLLRRSMGRGVPFARYRPRDHPPLQQPTAPAAHPFAQGGPPNPKRAPAANGCRGKAAAAAALAGACPKLAQWPTHRHVADGSQTSLLPYSLTYLLGHSTVHRLAPNAVLAERFNTIECLRCEPTLAKFAAFAGKQRETIGRTR